MKKKTIGIIIAVIIIVIGIIAGIIIRKDYVAKQRVKINDELAQMNSSLKISYDNFKKVNNQINKENVVKSIDNNISELKKIETESYNTSEMKTNEAKMMEAFVGAKSIDTINTQVLNISNKAKTFPKIPTASDIKELVNEYNSILTGKDLENVKNAESNSYFVNIFGENQYKNIYGGINKAISSGQEFLTLEKFFGMA